MFPSWDTRERGLCRGRFTLTNRASVADGSTHEKICNSSETLEAGEIKIQERVPAASSVFALQELNGNSDAVTLMRSCPKGKRLSKHS